MVPAHHAASLQRGYGSRAPARWTSVPRRRIAAQEIDMASTERIEGLIERPYWWDAAPREVASDTALPQRADAVVVGSGYAGLAAALTLARAGRSVVVLDAEAPGYGASSRSGGMIGHGHRLPYSTLADRFGPAKAAALVKEGVASLDHLVALVEQEGIDADLQRVGRFRGAATPADYEAQAREAERLTRETGVPVDIVPRAEQRREIASDLYHGGVVFPLHGGVHPAKLHTGLLAAARAAGATVIGFAPVTAIAADGGGHKVTTPSGTIHARDVLVTTNAYSGPATPDIARRVVGTPSFMIATEPLGANRIGALFPTRRMIVETAATHLYFRPSPDGERIVLGGRAALHPIPLPEAAGRLRALLATVFPELAGVRLTHAWTGKVGMTRSDLPGIGRRDGLWYAVGCNGSGVALMPYLGTKLAAKVLGQDDAVTAFDDIAPPAIPFYAGRAWFLPALTYWWRAKDALRTLRGG
jgi:gamma-glutamylputrescine oxidase